MGTERGVDRFAKALHDADDYAKIKSRGVFLMDRRMADLTLFALDDLQRQIDELKEEAR